MTDKLTVKMSWSKLTALFCFVTGFLFCSPVLSAETDTASSKLIETVNQRLQTENTELKEERSKLENDLNSLDADRKGVIDKLKMIAEENVRLKDRVEAFEKSAPNAPVEVKEQSPVFANETEEEQLLRQINEEAGKLRAELKQGMPEGFIPEENTVLDHETAIAPVYTPVPEIETPQKEDKDLQEVVRTMEAKLKDAEFELYVSRKNTENLLYETADMHYNQGVAFQEQNRPDDAIREYSMVLKTLPDDSDTHYNLGLIYDTVKNNRDKAIYHYTKYLNSTANSKDPSRAKIKERIVTLTSEQKIWGDPDIKGLGQKEKLSRW
jgi:tetratricopeptide (TPR) repeat protein